MAKNRIRRGNRVYVYERENYRDEFGKVKHRNTQYLGVEETVDGKTVITPPKRRRKDFQVIKSVRYGDIAVLYTILEEHGIITLLDELIPRRGLPVGDVFASLAINHIIDRKSLNKFSKWYDDTALAHFTKILGNKLNSTNLGAVMDALKIGPEGIVDVCIGLFKEISHLETELNTLFYDITSTYFYGTTLPKVRRGYSRDENNLPQINIALAVTQNKGFPLFFRTYEGNIPDVKTITQLVHDVKRVGLRSGVIILDRGMISTGNLRCLAESGLKVICGVPLTSNEAKGLVMQKISEENELIRPSGLLYYEDVPTTLFGIPGRAIVCFNHADLEKERTTRLKKTLIAEKKIEELLASKDRDLNGLKQEIKTAIYGVSKYFIVSQEDDKITVIPHIKNRREAKLCDGKYLIFTTDSEKSADKIISQYFGKDIIEKIFDCFKNWLDMHPVRHFDDGRVDVYVFVCFLAYLALTLYKDRLDSHGWGGVKTGLDELGRIRKTTLDFGGERVDKITVLTKEQEEIIARLGLKELFEKL